MTFELARFGDLFSEPQRNGLTRPKKIRGTGLPMVNMGELFAYSRIHNLKMDLVPVDEKEHHYLLAEGDLLFARQSLVLSGAGQCSIFMGNAIPTVFESHLIRCRLDTKRSNPLFYFYFFRSPDGRGAIETIVEQGAGASGIRGSDLINLQVPNPPKALQDRIAAMLGALDDRITLLRETNATLEAIAQALFKSWFVDFDPVRAKMAGRAPEGMDEATAALFPDAMEETELGAVPKGWVYCSLKEVVDILDSKRIPLSGAERAKRQGPYPYYGAAALMDHVDDYLFDGIYLLTGEDGSVADRAGFPITQYVWGKFWVNNHAHILQGRDGVSTEHVMLSLRQTNIQPYITGAVQAKLSQSNMWRIQFLRPRQPVSESFADILRPLFNRIRHNTELVETLASLRDNLLPRLISGQLRLPEVSPQMQEIA